MKYDILVYETAEQMAARTDPTRAEAYWGAYAAYSKALADAGIAAGGAALDVPALATTIRFKDGRQLVQDGPFADTKERLGGHFVIDVPDLDTALQWAARCPSTDGGAVEVRPLIVPPAGM